MRRWCPYDEAYWKKYQSYRGNGIGELITEGRANMTYRALADLGLLKENEQGLYPVTDIGIGSGEFVEAMPCYGTDINPHAVKWLKRRKVHNDPLSAKVETPVLTFWDVLEHIPDPKPLLDMAQVVLTSLPIYDNVQECLASKHLRPGEHLWHFTNGGIKRFMHLAGFKFIAADNFETQAGREGIITYAFRR